MDREEAAKEIIKRHCNDVSCTDNCLYGKENCMYSMAIEALQEPERMKGRWEEFDYDNSYRCTACGEIWTLNDGTPEENNMNYCSFCGADMRGKE